ncbi:hypothetical protein ACFYPK_19860 [Streptomyces halstedii]|uniref:hypothetical protein n=1 Tax=Streptomyces TaxID=1883 RepID=UPI0012FEB9DD|nr:hypothetical protein [Streptomyces sp. NTK 937]WSX34369.1 hypothetical protein OG291_01220 [Streptomyces halstedii]
MVSRLGDDWCDMSEGCDLDHTALSRELKTELHPAHPFFGASLEVIAHRQTNDDVLCHHLDTPARYSVLHLTWSGREEIRDCPTIDADGEWPHIVAYENGIDAALSTADAIEQDGRRAPMGPAGTTSRPLGTKAVHAWPEDPAIPQGPCWRKSCPHEE